MSRNQHPTVAIVGPWPPVIGGTAAMLKRLVPALEEAGASCRVFNTGVGDRQGGFGERLRRMFVFVGLAWRVLRSPEQVVHCHAVNFANLVGHGFVLAASRLGGKASVLTLHAGDLEEKLQAGGTRRLGAFVLRLARTVTTVTPALATLAGDLGCADAEFIPNALRYVPHGGDATELPDEVSSFLEDHDPVAVLVGAMGPPYGIDTLLRAAAELRTTHPSFGALVIAFKSSDTVYGEHIASLCDELDLAGTALLPAEFPNVAEALRRSDVFVRPTLSDGDSIAVREAITLGLPVVASDVGHRPEGVVLFPVGDHAALADAIRSALAAPPRGPLVAEESERTTVERYLAVFTRVADRRRGSAG